jgi:hypothetical protein
LKYTYIPTPVAMKRANDTTFRFGLPLPLLLLVDSLSGVAAGALGWDAVSVFC